MSAPWAILPVKTLAEAKQRLAGVLPQAARCRLMLVMLREVLATLDQVEQLGAILVVTPDAQVAEIAESSGALVLREERARGHTVAATAGLDYARARGAEVAFTVPADAPCTTAEEIALLIAAAEGGPRPRAVLVPARDGDGTNAVLTAPVGVLPLSFGSGSFARHRAAAEAVRLDCRTVELPGLAMDIDEPRDLRDLMERKRGDPRYAFLWNDEGGARLDLTADTDQA